MTTTCPSAVVAMLEAAAPLPAAAPDARGKHQPAARP